MGCDLIRLIILLIASIATVDGAQENDYAEQLQWIEEYNFVSGADKPDARLDHAWLTINSSLPYHLELYTQSDDCWKCPLQLTNVFHPGTVSTIVVDTNHATHMKLSVRISEDSLQEICRLTVDFQDYGDYWMFAGVNSTGCQIITANQPWNDKIPIAVTLAVLLGVWIAWNLGLMLYRKGKDRRLRCCGKIADISEGDEDSPPTMRSYDETRKSDTRLSSHPASMHSGQAPIKDTPRKRLKSLDTFRGISLAIMVFANFGSGHYWFLEHAAWNGLYVADLVFPWFIWIMGTAMALSFRGQLKRKTPRYKICLSVIRRSVVLFMLGIMLNTVFGNDMETLRIMGVLQRFGVTYLLLGIPEVVFCREDDSHQDEKWCALRDIVLYWPLWLINLTILSVFIGITYGLSVPGCPSGYTGPGGISENGAYFNCTGGAAKYLDNIILGVQHMYQWPTVGSLYQTPDPFDPEGVLGCLTSVFLCFLGLQAGRVIVYYPDHKDRIKRWLIWALVTGAIAALLCKGTANDGWIPLNKNLWSVSYILTMASFSFVLLIILYVFIDVWPVWSGSPFIYPGMNSIVVYFGHSALSMCVPFAWEIHRPEHWKLLTQDVWASALWCFIAYLMFRRKLFISV